MIGSQGRFKRFYFLRQYSIITQDGTRFSPFGHRLVLKHFLKVSGLRGSLGMKSQSGVPPSQDPFVNLNLPMFLCALFLL